MSPSHRTALRGAVAVASLMMIVWAIARLVIPDDGPGQLEYVVTNAGLPLAHDQYTVQVHDGTRLVAQSSADGTPLAVPPGTYVVTAFVPGSFPLASVSAPVQVAGGGRVTPIRLAVSFGELVIKPMVAAAARPSEVIVAQVFRAGQRQTALAAFDTAESVLLGHGSYDVRVVLSEGGKELLVRWLEGVDIEAGRQRRLDVGFRRGFVLVSAADNGQALTPEQATVFVQRADDALAEIIDSGPVGLPLSLPAGRYRIDVVHHELGEGFAAQIAPLEVSDGETLTLEATFETGVALVHARLGAAQPLDQHDVYVSFYAPDDHRRAIAYAPAGRPLRLPAGDYDIRAHFRRSADNAMVWRRGISIDAGTTFEYEVPFDSGTLLVRAAGGNERELVGEETTVEIFPQGARARPLARSVAGQRVTLSSGRYEICVRNTYTAEEQWHAVVVVAGEEREASVRFGK